MDNLWARANRRYFSRDWPWNSRPFSRGRRCDIFDGEATRNHMAPDHPAMPSMTEPMPPRLLQSRCRCAAIVAALITAGANGLNASNAQGEDASGAPTFEPGDISIGEPIALPFAGPRLNTPTSTPVPVFGEPAPAMSGMAGPAPGADQLTPIGPRVLSTVVPPPAPAAGQGWLGLAVAESAVPGRWIVDTVAPVGPAAAAGILPGDEVRGINGMPLRSADEVAQALTAIAPGQKVGLAIARGEQVRDMYLTAATRPAAPPFAAAVPRIEAIAAPPSGFAGLPSTPVMAPPAVINTPPVPGLAAAIPAAAFEPRVAQPAMPASESPATRFGGLSASSPAPGNPPATTSGLPADVPATGPRELAPPVGSGGRTALGVRTMPIDHDLQTRFRLSAASGAYVIGVIQDLPASRAGVPPGSVIVSLDDRPVRSPEELTQLVTSGPVGRPVSLEYVLPGGTPQRADVVLQTLEQPLVEALVGSAEPRTTGVPTLVPGPTLAPGPAGASVRRPVSGPEADSASAMRQEIEWLQARLRTLERRLDAVAR